MIIASSTLPLSIIVGLATVQIPCRVQPACNLNIRTPQRLSPRPSYIACWSGRPLKRKAAVMERWGEALARRLPAGG